VTPPSSTGPPPQTSPSGGRGHTWIPDPSEPGDPDAPVQRGRWAVPLVEATARTPGPEDEPPTEPMPVTEATAPADGGRMRHLRALDGLRGVAVFAVVMYHFAGSIVPGGFLGVDLFFVLSGFLITSLLVNEWERTTRLSLRAFWGRRARRLLPALLLVLGAVGAYTLFVGSHVDAEHIATDGLSALLYVANWHFISSGQSYIQQFVHSAPSPLRHMWSLAIEEQFYLIWPLVVLVVATVVPKRARRHGHQISQFRIGMVAVCVTLAVLSFIRMVTLYHGASDVNRVYYGTDSRAFVILVGAALGALSMGAPTLSGRARRRLIVAGCWGAVALLAAFAWTTTSSSYLYRGAYGAVALVMVLVLAAAAQPGENRLARILSTRPLVGLGLISYGVYLWHWPITVWVTPQTLGVGGVELFFVRCAITLAASLASYFLVEQPIRRGHLPGSFLKNPGVVPMVLVTAVAVVLLIPALAYPSLRTAPTSGGTGALLDAVTREYGAAPRCDNAAPAAPISPGRQLRVQLVGNSIAEEVRSCLGTILQARGAILEGVSPFGFDLCLIIPAVEKQLANPKTRPNVAIWFALDALDPDCGPKATFETPVLRLLKAWKADGVHVFLVPAIPPVLASASAGPDRNLYHYPDLRFYNAVARRDPTGITVLDAGTYLRSEAGVYQWRMPCLPGEPGCSADDTVGVRWTDGFHYCTYAPFGAEHNDCPSPQYQAGERRAAAGLASALLPKMTALFPPRRRDGS
jgi:peptidoglycan/LPS O-acetylase OafA/YrhL